MREMTPKQVDALVAAYETLHVKTIGSPDIEALSGPMMRALVKHGMAYHDDTIGRRMVYRLTRQGVATALDFWMSRHEPARDASKAAR